MAVFITVVFEKNVNRKGCPSGQPFYYAKGSVEHDGNNGFIKRAVVKNERGWIVDIWGGYWWFDYRNSAMDL